MSYILIIIIALIIGWNFGCEFALLVGILGCLVIYVLEKAAESSARSQTEDTRRYHQHRKADDGYEITESINLEYYYSVLGVAPNATDAELKKAYHKLVKECHPDRFANASEEVRKSAHERFCKIKEAFEVLKELRKMQ